VTRVTAADVDVRSLETHAARRGYGQRVACVGLDAGNRRALEDLIVRTRPDVIIDLLPATLVGTVVAAAVAHKVHLVNTLYTRPEVKALAGEAERRGVTILPECGFDPGIDLVLAGRIVRGFDRLVGLRSYGGGVPEASAADNPLRYKVTWTFAGVLNSYRRAGRMIRAGRAIEIGDDDMFRPEHVHQIEIESVGTCEAFPNGDALQYAELLGLELDALEELGRYTLRWPGHCALWLPLVELGLLDDEPVDVGGIPVSPRRFLDAALAPRLRYADHERDLAIVRVEAWGTRGGRAAREVLEVIDRRDLRTGLTAMSRTVGFTASIGAQMIASGEVARRGVLSPLRDLPYDRFCAELARRGILVRQA
jgi:saccharopine dehydrogenase-like NADP-dependent oxidoreductase